MKNVIGHNHIRDYFSGIVKRKSLHHAYVFSGPPSVGKKTFAMALIRSMFCTDANSFTACKKCASCIATHQNNHPDIYFVEREKDESSEKLAKNITIDQITFIQKFLQKSAFGNSYKILLVNDADYLSQKAANALLKTLEEPNKNTIIIIIATEASRLPQTVLSRCQHIPFLAVSDDEIYDHLISLGCDRDNARIFSRISSGRPGIAIELFQNPDIFKKLSDDIQVFLGAFSGSDHEKIRFASEVAKRQDLLTHEYSRIGLLDIWMLVLRDMLLEMSSNSHLKTTKNETSLYSAEVPYEKIVQSILALKEVKNQVGRNTQAKIALENFFIQYSV